MNTNNKFIAEELVKKVMISEGGSLEDDPEYISGMNFLEAARELHGYSVDIDYSLLFMASCRTIANFDSERFSDTFWWKLRANTLKLCATQAIHKYRELVNHYNITDEEMDHVYGCTRMKLLEALEIKDESFRLNKKPDSLKRIPESDWDRLLVLYKMVTSFIDCYQFDDESSLLPFIKQHEVKNTERPHD